mgnify:FL=1
MTKQTRNLMTMLAVVAMCLVFAVSCASLPGAKAQTERTISVSGTGTVSLEANMVSFRIEVSETADTTGEAQQATNKKMSQILSILRDSGIEDKDISTTALNFSTKYAWKDGVQTKVGEEVDQTVYVRLYDIDSFAPLADAIGSNVSGISFYNVSFDSSDRKEAENQARELAYQDALTKAQIYAKAAGLELGEPITIQDGYSSYVRNTLETGAVMYAKAEAADESYATEAPTGPLTVTSNVDIVFQLK